MIRTIDAIYENGVLKLPAPLALPEKAHVTVTIQTQPIDSERELWLRVSEDKLAKAWEDSDDVFNELLQK